MWLLPLAARAHDLTASHGIVRLKSNSLEVQIRIAADTAWPLAQEISPGAVFVSEDFEKVGRPLLLAVGKTLDTVKLDGKEVAPSQTNVVIAEDTFLFAFTYPLPAKGTLQLTETYLGKMSPDYLSHIRIFDSSGALVATKDLSKEKPVWELSFPIAKPRTPAAAAAGGPGGVATP